MICLVHFHLINPIMVNKKKTQDVQCFAEVMDSVQTLDAGRRSMYDPDEIEEEQREREQRNKVARKHYIHDFEHVTCSKSGCAFRAVFRMSCLL